MVSKTGKESLVKSCGFFFDRLRIQVIVESEVRNLRLSVCDFTECNILVGLYFISIGFFCRTPYLCTIGPNRFQKSLID